MNKAKKEKLVFLGLCILVIGVLLFSGAAPSLIHKLILGALFSVLLWLRTPNSLSRWLAIIVLWLGLAGTTFWNVYHLP